MITVQVNWCGPTKWTSSPSWACPDLIYVKFLFIEDEFTTSLSHMKERSDFYYGPVMKQFLS